MSWSTDWVFENSDAKGADRLILLSVANDFDFTLGCAPRFDLPRIAKRAGLSEKNAQRSLDRLIGAGRLVIAHGSVYLPRVP